jgi:hypothetical protein
MHHCGLAIGVLPMALAGCVTGDTLLYTRGDQTSTRIVQAVAHFTETRNSTYKQCWYMSGRAGGEDGLAGLPQACAQAAAGFWWFLSILVPERLTVSTSIPLPAGPDPEIVVRVPLPKIQGLHVRRNDRSTACTTSRSCLVTRPASSRRPGRPALDPL